MNDIEKDVSGSDVVWIGEVHGVVQNYMAHRDIINMLVRHGFKSVFWEMPEDEGQIFDDGRFGSESTLFLKWLRDKERVGEINLHLFDERHSLKKTSSPQELEDTLATGVVNLLSGKSIVISGNFHAQLREVGQFNEKIIPCALRVKNRLVDKNIIILGYKYAGGQAYNFGLIEIEKKYHAFDAENRGYGETSKNTNSQRDEKYWFHLGKAVPVSPIKGR